MTAHRLISASSCRRAAQLFNILTVAALLLSLTALLVGKLLADQRVTFLPLVMSLPPLMIWLGASIFVYAGIAHHPNARAVHYNKWAGYRFYGVMGSLMVFGPAIYGLLDGWKGLVLVQGLAVAIIVPWAIYDIFRAAREPWQDMDIEVEE